MGFLTFVGKSGKIHQDGSIAKIDQTEVTFKIYTEKKKPGTTLCVGGFTITVFPKRRSGVMKCNATRTSYEFSYSWFLFTTFNTDVLHKIIDTLTIN